MTSEPIAPAVAGRDGRVVRSIGGYRPGLDGIRALAVLAVAAYHAQLPHAGGGFLGVSLFFTLSGYLITAILLDEHERTGTVDLKRFWIRRFRRLVPAALLGLAVAVLFGATVASQSQIDGLAGEVVAGAAYFANWFFAYTDQSYAELFSSPSPVQHYWSLAIEEQFYMVMPLVLLGVLRVRRSVKFLLGVLVAGVLISAAWMAVRYNGGASIDRLYYGTDTRAAELLSGSALAALLHLIGLERLRSVARAMVVVGPLALAALVWSWSTQTLTGSTLFRGGFLLHALVSAVLVIAILVDRGPLPAFLKLKPLAYLGRISYGIYLFHWPIFLWLTEDRTGLDQWSLFAVRMALAIGAASASFALLEQPIRKGASLGLRGGLRWLAAPVAVAVLFAGATAAASRDAFDEAETIRVTENALGIPIAAADGVLDILAIGAPEGTGVLNELEALVADEATISVVVAEPFSCGGEPVQVEAGPVCPDWVDAWPQLIAEHDPDVVVFHASDWPGFSTPGQGEAVGAEAIEQSVALLNAGFDVLGAGGAPIVWLPTGRSTDERLERGQRSFSKAMDLLEKTRDDTFGMSFSRLPDITDPDFDALAATALLEDASLYQRSDREGLPRMLVVGDSQARSLGFGLQRWGDTESEAWVWNRGAPGCPFSVDGLVRFLGDAPVNPGCQEAVASFDRVVERFEPDVVLALAGDWDLVPRKLDAWEDFQTLGAAEFDAYLLSQLRDAHRRLSAGGATVVWLSAPCIGRGGSGLSADQIEAQSAVRETFNETVLADLLAAEPDAVFFDLDEALCPGGVSIEELPGVDTVRYDGLHFSVAGAEWFAATYGPELIALGES